MLVGSFLLAGLLLMKRLAPKVPGPLVAAAFAIGAVYFPATEWAGVKSLARYHRACRHHTSPQWPSPILDHWLWEQ